MKTQKYGLSVIVVGIATLLLSVVLLVVGTFALFTGKVETKNHLEAGSLEISLYREKLTTYNLKSDGTMDTEGQIDSVRKDFTNATVESVFGLDTNKNVLVAPTSKFIADMTVENHGSVAFSYWVELQLTSEVNILAEQLKVTVKSTDGTELGSATLKDGLTVGGASGIEVVKVSASATFTVEVEFTNIVNPTTESDNNYAKTQVVTFDLIVHATQAVSA